VLHRNGRALNSTHESISVPVHVMLCLRLPEPSARGNPDCVTCHRLRRPPGWSRSVGVSGRSAAVPAYQASHTPIRPVTRRETQNVAARS
jgi:hypothetical protein